MRDVNQRAEFFRLVAKLFYYILSGHSHVGNMRRCEGNRFCISPVWFSLTGRTDD